MPCPMADLILGDDERQPLKNWASRPEGTQRLASRADYLRLQRRPSTILCRANLAGLRLWAASQQVLRALDQPLLRSEGRQCRWAVR
jgi:hypothetical protein